jgi:protein tyrosine/serine phosphatase
MIFGKQFVKAVVFALFLAVATPAIADELSELKPDLPNFHEVLPGQIYRGGQPSAEGIRQLAKQGIKTIVDLRFEAPRVIVEERKLAKSLGITWYAVPMTPVTTPEEKDMDFILNNVLHDQSKRPLFIHCAQGEDRTGVVFALFRALHQQPAWTPQAAYDEMLEYGFHPYLTKLSNYYFEKTGWRP